MSETYAELARILKQNGASHEEIMHFALLAIADQMRASNEVAIIEILISLGQTTPNIPSDDDLKNIREHLYKTLDWGDIRP